jgi:hypothetical protein
VTPIKLSIFQRTPGADLLLQGTIAKQRNISSRTWVLFDKTVLAPLDTMSEMKPITVWNNFTDTSIRGHGYTGRLLLCSF